MAGTRSRALLSLASIRARAAAPIHSRSGHSGASGGAGGVGGGDGEPWEDSVDVDKDPNVGRRFGRVLREHKICRAVPEWLPLVPGSCYWIPPDDLALVPSDALGFMRNLSDGEARDVMKRLRVSPSPSLPLPVKEVVIVVDLPDVDDQLEELSSSFVKKQG